MRGHIYATAWVSICVLSRPMPVLSAARRVARRGGGIGGAFAHEKSPGVKMEWLDEWSRVIFCVRDSRELLTFLCLQVETRRGLFI